MITSKALTRKDGSNAGITKQINGYYQEEQDDYYTKDKQPSEWFGQLAQDLGLNGQNVEKQDFANLLGGNFRGETLRDSTYKKKRANDRLGMDFTCNAPKSVSIQALVAGDTRLIQAHNEAVKESLAILESKAQGRKKVGGRSRVENTQNIAVALFRHDTSREKDPHLHTHSVMLNITKRSDGEYRALHNDEIMKVKAEASQAYQTNLAKKCKALGYDIRINENGTFDLAHISREQIEKFSTRSKQIEANLAKQGLSRKTASKEQRQIANLNTRRAKETGNKAETQKKWYQTAKEMGLNIILAPKNAIKRKETLNERDNTNDQLTGRFGRTERGDERDNTSGNGIERTRNNGNQTEKNAQAEKIQTREPSRDYDNGDNGRAVTSRNEASSDIKNHNNQPSVEKSRTQKNAEANSLHELPSSNVADTTTGRKVLLQDNPQLELHEQRANGNSGMRWGIDGIRGIKSIANAFKLKIGLGQEEIKNLEETQHINDIRNLDSKAKFDEPLTQNKEERETLKDMMTYEAPTDELKNEWAELARELNINFEPGQATYEDDYEFSGDKLMTHVVEHLIDKKVDLTEKEIIQETLIKGLGEIDYQGAEELLKNFIANGNLIKAEPLYRTASDKDDTQAKTVEQWKKVITKDGAGEIGEEAAYQAIWQGIEEGRLIPIRERYVTKEDLATEKRILQTMQEGRGTKQAFYSVEEAEKRLENSTLNEGQKAAAKLIMTTEDSVIGIQGYAGVGKSYTLTETLKHVNEAGGTAHVFAPYGSQVKSLREDGHEAFTLAKLLSSKKLQDDITEKSVIVIDEAGVVANKEADKLLQFAKSKNAKVVLLGDTQQTKAINAGKPFDILQNNGMAMAVIDDIQRQKDETLKKAVVEAAMDKPQESVKTLEKSIFEITKREDRLDTLVAKYVELDEADRKKTLIVTGTNEDKDYINEAIRQELGLAGKGIVSEQLKRVDMSKAEMKHARYYKEGDLIETQTNPKDKNLQKGELYEIVGRNGNMLQLKDNNGRELQINPTLENLAVYRNKEFEIAVNDRLRVTKGNSELGTTTGDKLIVESINKNHFTARDEKTNELFSFSTKEKNHLDHDYCSTVHSSQGLTVDRVLINIDTKSRTTGKEVYYVAVSRAKHEAYVVTDNIERLPNVIAKGAEKHSAYEMVSKQDRQETLQVSRNHELKHEVNELEM